MLNYIRAEIYKLLRRKYTYITLGVLLALEGLFAATFMFHNAHSSPSYFGEAVIYLVMLAGGIGFCISMMNGDMVFAAQYKHATLKNEVSFGLSRTRIYLGKLITLALLAMSYLVVMAAFFLGLCALALPHGTDTVLTIPDVVIPAGLAGDAGALRILGWFLAAALPLWLGGLGVVCMFLFLVPSDLAVGCASLGVNLTLATIVEVAGLLIRGPVGSMLVRISQYFPWPMLDRAPALVGNWAYLGQAWLVGAFWLALSTAIGLYGFHRKEIK